MGAHPSGSERDAVRDVVSREREGASSASALQLMKALYHRRAQPDPDPDPDPDPNRSPDPDPNHNPNQVLYHSRAKSRGSLTMRDL